MSCADNEARLYTKRFARGSVGKCIFFKGKWCTPNEFQLISGRKSSKDWKRSIRLGDRILKEYITQGLFEEHSKLCSCKICSCSNVDMLKQEGEMALAALLINNPNCLSKLSFYLIKTFDRKFESILLAVYLMTIS